MLLELTLREKIPGTKFFWSIFSRIRIEYKLKLRIQSEYGKIRTRKSSVSGHFSRSANIFIKNLESHKLSK